MKKNQRGLTTFELIITVLVLAILVVAWVVVHHRQTSKKSDNQAAQAAYKPNINPADFSTTITNKYFSLPIGKKLVYEATTKDGPERVEIEVSSESKTIMGVKTLLYHDQV